MKQLDIKVLLAALVGCYGLLHLLLGTVLAALIPAGDLAESTSTVAVGITAVATFAVPPLAAGYFTARFAANRPQLHVLLIALLGATLVWSLGTSPWVAAISLPIAGLGAFVQLRAQQHAT